MLICCVSHRIQLRPWSRLTIDIKARGRNLTDSTSGAVNQLPECLWRFCIIRKLEIDSNNGNGCDFVFFHIDIMAATQRLFSNFFTMGILPIKLSFKPSDVRNMCTIICLNFNEPYKGPGHSWHSSSAAYSPVKISLFRQGAEG